MFAVIIFALLAVPFSLGVLFASALGFLAYYSILAAYFIVAVVIWGIASATAGLTGGRWMYYGTTTFVYGWAALMSANWVASVAWGEPTGFTSTYPRLLVVHAWAPILFAPHPTPERLALDCLLWLLNDGLIGAVVAMLTGVVELELGLLMAMLTFGRWPKSLTLWGYVWVKLSRRWARRMAARGESDGHTNSGELPAADPVDCRP